MPPPIRLSLPFKMLGCLAIILASVLGWSVAWGQPSGGGPGPGPAPPLASNLTVSPDGLFNVTAANLLHWRKAVASVRNGTGRGKLLLMGDSTTSGFGAGSGGGYVGAFQQNWPRTLAAMLNTAGIPTADNSFYNDQQLAIVAYGTYDTRVTLGANWSQTPPSLAGELFKYTNGAANNLSFTPSGSIDTVIVRYLRQAAQGSFDTNVDGGASMGLTSAAGAGALLSVQFAPARAAHTINIVPDNTNPIFFAGITAYDSTVPAIDLIQLGYQGALTAQLITTGNAWSPMTALATLAPDLTIISLTINDSNNVTALATYQTQLQTIITAAKATGDVLLLTGPPSNTAQATNGTLDQYIAVERTLALANNVGLIDLKTRWQSFALFNAVMPYFDALHPSALGYRDIPPAILAVLTR